MTRFLSEDEILSAMAEPLHLPCFPSNTQGVERYIPVLEEACGQRAGFTARNRYILSLDKSRSLVPNFSTKKDDSKF